jgi:hypothetical protein
MSAIFSPCGTYRYRLEREVQLVGVVFAYFGINGSTATADVDDQTVRKWNGFTLRNGGRRFLVGNPFAFRATDVGALARAADPVGPDNERHLRSIIEDADILVACWGPRTKVPAHLRPHYKRLSDMLVNSGKPLKAFGFSKDGDPLHVLTLGYARQLTDWTGYQ